MIVLYILLVLFVIFLIISLVSDFFEIRNNYTEKVSTKEIDAEKVYTKEIDVEKVFNYKEILKKEKEKRNQQLKIYKELQDSIYLLVKEICVDILADKFDSFYCSESYRDGMIWITINSYKKHYRFTCSKSLVIINLSNIEDLYHSKLLKDDSCDYFDTYKQMKKDLTKLRDELKEYKLLKEREE
jgi:hypothetical protein